jgi:flagellar hook-length control protein FliK
MQEAVDSVRATIELGVRQGTSQARIELSPPSLGTIRIQLQRTDDGVTARVTTDHAATADTLSQGGDDLRRSLQQAGVTLVRLDIETRGDAQSQNQTNNPAQDSAPSHQPSVEEADDIAGDAGQIEPTALVLPGSARVNVLA